MKPGYTTTEFWVTLITQALALVSVLHPGFNAHQWDPIASAIATIAAAVATGLYSLSRAHAKAANSYANSSTTHTSNVPPVPATVVVNAAGVPAQPAQPAQPENATDKPPSFVN